MPYPVNDLPRAVESIMLRTERTDSCWLFRGRRGGGRGAYGTVRMKNRGRVYAHRLVWERYHKNEVPDGFVVHHICENPLCVRPTHLELMPRGEHQRMHAERKL